MNFNSSEEIRKAFQELLKIQDEKEDIKFQTQMLMYRFLSEVEILAEEHKMTRKELAQKTGTSPSYITQLYRGNKPLNIETIAKFQKVFDVTFEIKAKPNNKAKIPEGNQIPVKRNVTRIKTRQATISAAHL